MSYSKKSLKNAALWIAILLLPMLVGCQGMALNPEVSQTIDTHRKSIAIFTLVVENQVNPRCGVAPISMWVKSDKAEETQFALAGDWNGNGGPFFLYYTGRSEFPVSLQLEPGKYTIGEIFGGGTNILIPWNFDFPLNTEFDLQPGAVVYLGHVVMTNRPRKDNEPRSGWVVPFLEQCISGLSCGTMDISITDQSGQDIPRFQAKYPSLKGVTIEKAIMSKGEDKRTAMAD